MVSGGGQTSSNSSVEVFAMEASDMVAYTGPLLPSGSPLDINRGCILVEKRIGLGLAGRAFSVAQQSQSSPNGVRDR